MTMSHELVRAPESVSEVAAASLCSHCEKPAVYAYTWAWGESGKCCQEHQFLLNQRAQNLSRDISFTSLAAGVLPPIDRDERLAFNAKVLTLEQELVESKARNLELHKVKDQLASEARIQIAKTTDLEQRLNSAREEHAILQDKYLNATADLAETREELERVKAAVTDYAVLDRQLVEARDEIERLRKELAVATGTE